MASRPSRQPRCARSLAPKRSPPPSGWESPNLTGLVMDAAGHVALGRPVVSLTRFFPISALNRDCSPHAQGFIAAISMKFAGNDSEPRARLMVTWWAARPPKAIGRS